MSVMDYRPLSWERDEFPHVQRKNRRGQSRRENRRKTTRLVKRSDQRHAASEIKREILEWEKDMDVKYAIEMLIVFFGQPQWVPLGFEYTSQEEALEELEMCERDCPEDEFRVLIYSEKM